MHNRSTVFIQCVTAVIISFIFGAVILSLGYIYLDKRSNMQALKIAVANTSRSPEGARLTEKNKGQFELACKTPVGTPPPIIHSSEKKQNSIFRNRTW